MSKPTFVDENRLYEMIGLKFYFVECAKICGIRYSDE